MNATCNYYSVQEFTTCGSRTQYTSINFSPYVSEVRTVSIIKAMNKQRARNRVEIPESAGQGRILAGRMGKGVKIR
jgi:hypothetical protein